MGTHTCGRGGGDFSTGEGKGPPAKAGQATRRGRRRTPSHAPQPESHPLGEPHRLQHRPANGHGIGRRPRLLGSSCFWFVRLLLLFSLIHAARMGYVSRWYKPARPSCRSPRRPQPPAPPSHAPQTPNPFNHHPHGRSRASRGHQVEGGWREAHDRGQKDKAPAGRPMEAAITRRAGPGRAP